MPTIIPNRINIIRLGSFLSEEHQRRIINWKRLNPQHETMLWIDKSLLTPQEISQFEVFSKSHQIGLYDVSTLQPQMSANTKLFLDQLNKATIKNYGALSDDYRYFVLNKHGGWYFDTDYDSVSSLPIDLALEYGFAVHAEYDTNIRGENRLVGLLPSVLVSAPETPFLKSAIAIIDKFSLYPSLIEVLNSEDKLIRYLSTHFTTGTIARAACGNLRHSPDTRPLIYVLDKDNDGKVTDTRVFCEYSLRRLGLHVHYKIGSESSWLTDPRLKNQEAFDAFIKPHKIFIGDNRKPKICDDATEMFAELIHSIQPLEIQPPSLDESTCYVSIPCEASIRR